MNTKLPVFLFLALFLSVTLWAAAQRQPPPARSPGEVQAIIRKAPRPPEGSELRRLNIVLLADEKDHGENEHDYPFWQKRWAQLVGNAPRVEIGAAWGWPSADQFQKADVIVANCYLKWSPARLEQVGSYLSRGGALVVIHPASWTMPGPSEEVAELLGVGGYLYYRHGPVQIRIAAPEHPICVGLPETLNFVDETYWPPTPFKNRAEILATSEEKISPDSENRGPQPVIWTYQYGKGRVFGALLGHYVWTFEDPLFQLLLLRGVAWAAGDSPYRFDGLLAQTEPGA
jgi:type 1 glutamine amidotransferase